MQYYITTHLYIDAVYWKELLRIVIMYNNTNRISRQFFKNKHNKKAKRKLICFTFVFIICVCTGIYLIDVNDYAPNRDTILYNIKKYSNWELTEKVSILELKLNETIEHISDLQYTIDHMEMQLNTKTTETNNKINNLVNYNKYLNKDKNCKLIFTLSSAHSGNEYLFEIFSNVPEMQANYRSPPNMGGNTLLTLKTLGWKDTYYTRKHMKIRSIEDQMNTGMVWFESSHLFIESWYDIAMDYFLNQRACDVKIIVLRRYLPYVINDLLKEGFNNNERNYYHSYTSKTAILPAVPYKRKRQRALDQIIWYLLDTEMQINKFKKLYPHANIIDVRVETLQNRSELKKLFTTLGIAEDKAPSSLIFEPPNISKETENRFINTVSEIIKEYKDINIEIPYVINSLKK